MAAAAIPEVLAAGGEAAAAGGEAAAAGGEAAAASGEATAAESGSTSRTKEFAKGRQSGNGDQKEQKKSTPGADPMSVIANGYLT
jgi:hypothetical protein